MKSFTAAVLITACAIPTVYTTLPSGITIGSGFSLPFITLPSAATTAGTGGALSGLAITGLTSGTALAAGLGGVVAAAGAGALLAGALAAAQRRGKRSVVVSDEEVGEQFIFDSIDAMDKNDCGKRYVCELAASPVEQLSQAELTSLLLFQTRSSVPNSGKAKFDEAVRLGVLTRSHLACQRRYATCPNADQ